MHRAIVNRALAVHRGYTCTCDMCRQNPIRGARFYCVGLDFRSLTACQTCFLQLPDQHKNCFFHVFPSLAANNQEGGAERERHVNIEGVHKIVNENSGVIPWFRRNPLYMIRKMYGAWKGHFAYHYDSRCSGCGKSPVPAWIFHCIECEGVSLCQECCLGGGETQKHLIQHKMLATHSLKMKHVIGEELTMVGYGGIIFCLLVVLFVVLGKLLAILWSSVNHKVDGFGTSGSKALTD